MDRYRALQRTRGRLPSPAASSQSLRALSVTVEIQCADPALRRLLRTYSGPMRIRKSTPNLSYAITPSNGFSRVDRTGHPPSVGTASNAGELLFLLDQDLTVELQKIRRDLYFVHAAVITLRGRAVLLVAASGGGKSTTAWAFLHHGFRYLSDELAPIDLTRMTVHPYPRALLLKHRPPGPYPLPGSTVSTARGFTVPAHALPRRPSCAPAPLAAVFFLHYPASDAAPALRRISAAQAAARLYANALNPLAHPADGLDGAIRIATAIDSFELTTADLARACRIVKDVLQSLPPKRPSASRSQDAADTPREEPCQL